MIGQFQRSIGLLAAGVCLTTFSLSGLSQTVEPACLNLSDEQMEEFLREAAVVRKRGISTGITGTTRLTLTKDGLTHDAHLQTIDVRKSQYQTPMGTELNFRDCYKFNIAAYKLDRMIGQNLVPVSVERKIEGKTGAVTWWVDDVQMMEKERYQKKIRPPYPVKWNHQLYQVRVFNQLVYNNDPNLGNLLITNGWDVWMVDFSRAFRIQKKLRNEKDLTKIDRAIYQRLKSLDPAVVAEELKPLLMKNEIQGIMARRDKIIEFFDRKIAEQGENVVFFHLPERAHKGEK